MLPDAARIKENLPLFQNFPREACRQTPLPSTAYFFFKAVYFVLFSVENSVGFVEFSVQVYLITI